jgi:hypothetical protein
MHGKLAASDTGAGAGAGEDGHSEGPKKFQNNRCRSRVRTFEGGKQGNPHACLPGVHRHSFFNLIGINPIPQELGCSVFAPL